MAPPSLAMLHLATARRATFNKSRKGQNRALNWPYPLTAAAAKSSSIHPDRLVEAGFYCTPTSDDPTVTTCYLCEIVVGQWEEGEDPLYRHEAAIEEAEIQCAYLDVLTQSWSPVTAGEDAQDDKGAYLASVPQSEWKERWSGDGAEYHPRSERMHQARLATFRLGWPHAAAAGVPTKEAIAAAGWVFRPGADEESEDQCACIYCGRTVEGWEQGDDPVALHRRKIGLKCPFFIADDPPATDAAIVEAHTEVDAEEAQEDEEEEEQEEEEEPEPVKPIRGAKKASTRASTATKKSARGTAAKKKGKEPERDADHDDDVDAEEEVQAVDEPTPAANRDPERDEEDADEEELAPKAAKKGKGKAAPKKLTAARPTTTRSTRAKTTPAVSDAEDAPEQADVSVMRKSTRARAASNASTASSVPPPRAAALSKSTRSRAPAPSKTNAAESSKVDVLTAEAPTEVEVPKQKRASKKVHEPKRTVVASATCDEGTSPDDSLAQLALIADAALEAQGPADEEATTKTSKKSTRSAASASSSSEPTPSAASASSSTAGGKAKKGKKADAKSPPIEAAAPVRDSPKEVAMQEEASDSAASELPAAATSPRPVLPLSASRPIRSLPTNKSSKSPSSTSFAPVPTPAAPPPLPSASSSQSSLPTSAFETASERLSAPIAVPTVIDPAAPFTAPTNPFAGSSLLSLVPPPTRHELDSLTVAEWYTLCYDRIRARFENENAALRNHLEARLDLGRNKLRDMADEAKAREDREAAQDAENRRRLAKERKERIGASGGGNRSAVKAGGGGSTRKMR